MTQKINIAIVEDDRVLRESLCQIFRMNEKFDCKGVYPNGVQFLNALPTLKADVVLMDISMPGISGIDCVKQAKEQNATCQFLMHTVFDDEEKIFQALKYGATGYLLKGATPDEIYDSVISVYNGGSPMTAVIARKVVSSFAYQQISRPQNQLLSEKEMQIAENLAKGLRYQEIADKLSISIDTVRTHIRHIYEKLQVNSKIEAINKLFPNGNY